MVERAVLNLEPKKGVIMFHTVLCIDASKKPIAVCITTNPLEHQHYAQVVMHKTRSHGCAVQVARYVRRRFDIEEPVTTLRAPRAVEAMIGYACTRSAQFPPNENTPGWGVFQHIAATPIAALLKEVADGHNAARTRYVVYEVRSAQHELLRGITHAFNALERWYKEAPPDTLIRPDIVQIGRFASQEEARSHLGQRPPAGDHLWTRKPPADYVRRILKLVGDELQWTYDDAPAIREYDFRAVVIGPHVYTEHQIRYVLEHGVWVDGRTLEGRRIMALART